MPAALQWHGFEFSTALPPLSGCPLDVEALGRIGGFLHARLRGLACRGRHGNVPGCRGPLTQIGNGNRNTSTREDGSVRCDTAPAPVVYDVDSVCLRYLHPGMYGANPMNTPLFRVRLPGPVRLPLLAQRGSAQAARPSHATASPDRHRIPRAAPRNTAAKPRSSDQAIWRTCPVRHRKPPAHR